MDLNSCASNITSSHTCIENTFFMHFCLSAQNCLDFVFFLILVTFLGNSQNHGFLIEYSEANVRDIDSNPCALDSPTVSLNFRMHLDLNP